MSTTTTTATATYVVTVPVTMYQTLIIEGSAGMAKDQVCDTITWESTSGQELSKAERTAVLQSLTDTRWLVDVEEESVG